MEAINNLIKIFKSYTIEGVDPTIPGNGGKECTEFLTTNRRIWETLLIVTISLIEIIYSSKKIKQNNEADDKSLPVLEKNCSPNTIKILRRLVLFISIATYSLEVYYKVNRGSLIFLLNPCHVLNAFHIYFLTSNSSRSELQRLFRIHNHLVSGALIALVLPVTNTRPTALDVTSYWMQHLTIYFIVPIFMFASGHRSEKLTDVNWPLLSCGWGFLYHFVVLQSLGMLTQVNLNNMICPAVSDPFHGDNYRMWALLHQHLLIFLHGKLYTLLILTLVWIIEVFVKFCSWLSRITMRSNPPLVDVTILKKNK